jgi:hypothetical protein
MRKMPRKTADLQLEAASFFVEKQTLNNGF